MECRSSQNWFWSERSCSWIRVSHFSRSGRQKRGNLQSYGGKKHVRARLGPLHLNWPEQVLFDRLEWTNGTGPMITLSFWNGHIVHVFVVNLVKIITKIRCLYHQETIVTQHWLYKRHHITHTETSQVLLTCHLG